MAENFTLIVHGGARDIPENLSKKHHAGIEKAVKSGFGCLEDDPGFDAVKMLFHIFPQKNRLSAGS